MPLFAAGGEAIIGPIDFTPVYLAGLAGAAAGWRLVWLLTNEHFRANLDAESAGFLALMAAVCAACAGGVCRLARPGVGTG